MRRGYEFKQEINHQMHETRSWGTTTYPLTSHEEYYYHAPPPPPQAQPNMQKMLNHPTMPSTFHYDLSDDEDNHHHYQQLVVHDDRRKIHHDDRGDNRSWYGAHHHGDEEKKSNKHRGSILRPPLGYVGRHQTYQNRPPMVVDQEVKNQNGYISRHQNHPPSPAQIGFDHEMEENQHDGYSMSCHQNHQHGPQMARYSGEGSRIIDNNNQHIMEDYNTNNKNNKKRYPSYDVSRFKDDENYDHHARILSDDYMESLIKGMHGLGGGMVKKIEVIEYEKSTYRGGRQGGKVLSNGYPKSDAPSWVKGF